jgi:hypothetical protein
MTPALNARLRNGKSKNAAVSKKKFEANKLKKRVLCRKNLAKCR